MKVVLRQKYFSFWHPSYEVFNEQGDILSKITAKRGFCLKLMICDSEGNYNLVMKRRYGRLIPRRDIVDAEGNLLYIIKKKFWAINKYIIKTKDEKDAYTLTGNVIGWNFILKRGEDVVAGYSKKLISLVDNYEIEVVDPADLEFALAVGVALDSSRSNRSSNSTSGHSGLLDLFRR